MSESTVLVTTSDCSPSSCSSTALAFKQGDPAALSAVYQQHRAEVLRLVKFGCGGRRVPQADREDVAQVVFLHLFSETARRAYDPSRPLGAYIRTIARNTVLDYWRRLFRRPTGCGIDAAEVQVEDPSARNCESYPDLCRLTAATAAFWQSQSPELQRFVYLRYIEERSQRDMLEPTGWSRRQVRTLETLVRAELSAHLVAHGLEASEVLRP